MKSKTDKILEAMANSKASLEHEGFQVTDEINNLVYKKLSGEIDQKEFDKRVRELAENNRDCEKN
ncbi:hypothetical protein NW801_21925 [Brevibacillus laterosporus]|uniref:Antitoxin VbhA domain-containing protein n=1 Tax=Brevibacillus halotolerans TaxID=1507437 RepID=A0ABT4I4L9_9BACL|nr:MULTISPECIES: hypothetical protein [Brevibacillus]MCR8987651.1 hypothetical protein [Brevibacillus laterosporus]MCZ0833390.1 hypothetical protein [Brevibacillus halotolerans]